jgi:hypothetical protein
MTTWAGERSLRHCLQQSPPPILDLQRRLHPTAGTAVEPNRGCSFMAASTLITGLSGGGVIVLVYTLLDPQRTSYGFGYGSFLVPSRTRPCPSGGCLCHHFTLALEPMAGRHRPRHIVHNIRIWGHLCQWLALFVAVVLNTHKHTYNMPLPHLGSS